MAEGGRGGEGGGVKSNSLVIDYFIFMEQFDKFGIPHLP